MHIDVQKERKSMFWTAFKHL